MYFDQLNGRMLNGAGIVDLLAFKPMTAANPGARFSLDKIDKTMLFMKNGLVVRTVPIGSDFNYYAVFEDKDGAKKRQLYIFNRASPESPDISHIDISNQTDINKAFTFDLINTSPTLYYATPGHIYLLKIDALGNSVSQAGVQFSAPANEEITAMFSDNNARCYVATYSSVAGESKVYLLSRSTGTGAFVQTPVKVWTGIQGRITQMNLKVS
jgi:hypothetical protein